MISTVKNLVSDVDERFLTIRGDNATDLSFKLNRLKMDFSVRGVGMDLDSRPFAIIEVQQVENKKLIKKKLGA